MKRLAFFVLAAICFFPLAANAGTAQARLYCTSVQFSELVNDFGDTLDLTSTGSLGAGAGELHPPLPAGELTLPGPENYTSAAILYSVFGASTFNGVVDINIPPFADLNTNRFPDFFEVSRSVSYTAFSGRMTVYDPSGTYTDFIDTTYTRVAGSSTGTISIDTHDDYWGTFNGFFQILEYTGPLNYTPGTNTIVCTINLTQTGNPSNTVSGPISFMKAPDTNHFNELTNNVGSWPGAQLSSVSTFTNHYFFRDLAFPTNYAGYIEFSDYSGTFEPYSLWVLSITDTNDLNHNGIPDFVDDSVSSGPRPPQLSLARAPGNLQLTIAGDTGFLYTVQETTSLSSPNWQNTTSFTLTNSPQTVTLALPGVNTYWRVSAQ